jgi:hypothetical protein
MLTWCRLIARSRGLLRLFFFPSTCPSHLSHLPFLRLLIVFVLHLTAYQRCTNGTSTKTYRSSMSSPISFRNLRAASPFAFLPICNLSLASVYIAISMMSKDQTCRLRKTCLHHPRHLRPLRASDVTRDVDPCLHHGLSISLHPAI